MYSILTWVKHRIFRPRTSSVSRPGTAQPATTQSVELDEPHKEIKAIHHGTVTVTGNHIFVTNPDGVGSFATITIPHDDRLTVTIDGQKKVGRVFVHESQDIKVMLAQSAPSNKFSIQVSADSMTVEAKVDVVLGKEYRLKGTENVHHALLALEEQGILPKPLETSELVAQVEAGGYHGEIDQTALADLAQSGESAGAVILRGTPPTPGKAACYKAVKLPEVYDPLHRRMRVSTVSVGTIVAVLEPEIPGVPGIDVYGRKVPVSAHRPLPALGAGVVEVNGQVVATRNGRVIFTKRRVDVIPELVIGHDLSSKDGKIDFDGNVIILGTVHDGSSVKATGSVEVHGSVLCSTIIAERGVFVAKAIVGSQVLIGQSIFVLAKLHAMIKECLDLFHRFRTEYIEVAKQVRAQYKQKLHLPILADVLLTKRHPSLVQLLTNLADDGDDIAGTNGRYRQIVSVLRSKWAGIRRTNIVEPDVNSLQRLLEDYVAYLESIAAPEPAEIHAGSVTSSSIRASGNIVITGSGVYASSFESGDSIVVRGTVRGGFLVARSLVRIYALGTETGTESSVKVSHPSGQIVIGIRYPNTLLQVGSMRDRNVETRRNVVCRGDNCADKNTSRRRLA